MTSLERSTASVVRVVGLTALTLLLAAQELLVRQPRAYLTPSNQFGAALAYAALGAAAGLWLALSVRRPERACVVLLLALSLHLPFSIAAFLWAFQTPGLDDVACLLVPALGGGLLCASLVCLARGFSAAFRELGLVARLIAPKSFLLGLVVLVLASTVTARLGLARGALCLGVVIAIAALRLDAAARFLWSAAPRHVWLRTTCALGSALLSTALLLKAGNLVSPKELERHAGSVVFASGTGRERVLVTSAQGAFSLFVGDSLRWSGLDGTRYVDALVAPALALSSAPKRCLVLGGSDGVIARKLLDAGEVSQVTLVTPETTLARLGASLWPLRELTRRALSDPRVTVVDDEPLPWLEARSGAAPDFDLVVIDLPDPVDAVAGKNFTRYFYERVRDALSEDGVVTTQAAPLLRAPRVYENVARTMSAAGFAVAPYEAELPALGLWGFFLAVPNASRFAEGPVFERRVRFPELDPGLPLRQLAPDTRLSAQGDEPPTHLYDLRVVHLVGETRGAEQSALEEIERHLQGTSHP